MVALLVLDILADSLRTIVLCVVCNSGSGCRVFSRACYSIAPDCCKQLTFLILAVFFRTCITNFALDAMLSKMVFCITYSLISKNDFTTTLNGFSLTFKLVVIYNPPRNTDSWTEFFSSSYPQFLSSDQNASVQSSQIV